jgi:hypothetical protein
MDDEALIDHIPSLSHDRMSFVFSAFRKRHTDGSHSLHVCRMLVENGIA